jgi:hypothetical protein
MICEKVLFSIENMDNIVKQWENTIGTHLRDHGRHAYLSSALDSLKGKK